LKSHLEVQEEVMKPISLLVCLIAMLLSPPAPPHDSPFACNVSALSSAERKRHFEELGPALRALRTGVRELPDGYEFEFRGDPKTVAMLAEWSVQERLCCPFFDIDLRLAREGGPAVLRLTGREGTKEFIRIDGAAWIKR
jgi:hypothetical protein